ncbi:hypothetical protein N7468_003304 [Penicillium chermesinum]|uniref:Serine/arginine repetitive matrix protein 1 n=1 Tax=Penicillium chermesinum TaxID=63820 RepID=A0A9W9P6G3_9EURO|nr:uncharacterized protein N7468_003304 [Penicillium chermesinum]KAJ5238685.1 hypothetical protein N7468_003304 [Penicillium chermesinum]KAJ6164329.1 hypothetical protein N7470_003001 [Penicillium chermesinum]
MRSGPGTPAYSSPGAKSLSRPPSPLHYAGPARGPPPMRNRSRSPAQQSPSRHYSDRLGPRSHRDREGAFNADAVNCQNGSGSLDRVEKENTKADQSRASRDTPTQPRNSRTSQSPPTGPANDSNPTANTHQASSTLSLLSAPTRPRRGPGSRDGPWGGGPIVRRGPPTTTPPNAPSGPRASFIPNSASAGFSGPGHYRHSTPRQNNPPPLTTSALPKATNHLANLSTVLPGGRMLPSALDAATEKRFSQLEADQEKLLEQLADAQRLKRAGLRDWDRLDRETSICALKSELAEGHLQRIADESLAGGIPF